MLALCVSAACVNRSPASPTDAPGGDGAVRTVTSLETGDPIPFAHVTIDSKELTADDHGRVTFDGVPARDAAVTLSAPGFLSRDTLGSAPSFSMFASRPGFDADFLKQIVYNGGTVNYHPAAKAYVRLASELRGTPAEDAMRAAVAQVNGDLGEAAFELTDAPPSGAIVYDVRVDPTIASGGLTYLALSGSRVTSGTIRFASMAMAAFVPLATHELGHAAGLNGHDPGPGLMTAVIPAGITDFTPSEKLALKIRTRPSGVTYVDNDRVALYAQAAVSGEGGASITIRCGAR